MFMLGRIPAVSDHFEYGGLRFEVLDMDRHRIDKVLASPSESDTAPIASKRGQSKRA
jgi:putative hemolysin